MTELLRMGLGLARIAVEAKEHGERLVVVNAEGHPDREIVLPMS